MSVPRVGFAVVPYLPPESVRELAVAADASGLDELAVWEDCFAQSGLATAAAALAWTERIRVGVGLMPAPLRNVALTAMEIATLERLFPGRVAPAVGHGVQDWMRRAGVRAESPLTLLREYVTALGSLLAGDEVSTDGRYVRLDGVRLEWPPALAPTVAVGGEGPRTIELAAELSDTFLLTAALTDDEITAVRGTLEETRARLRPGGGPPGLVAQQLVATGPGARDRVDAELPNWRAAAVVPGLGSAGDAEAVAADFRRLGALGVTTIVVQPTRDEPDLPGLARFLGEQVRPLLG